MISTMTWQMHLQGRLFQLKDDQTTDKDTGGGRRLQ